MNRIVFAFPGNELLAHQLMNALNFEAGAWTWHHFPDGESLVRLESDVAGKEVILIASLDNPDSKILSIYYLCKKIKTEGAAHLALVAPYLAYMRQDKSFHKGEAVSSIYFASLLSSFADELITIDPHLHRFQSLSDLYSIPCTTLHATQLISNWIAANVVKPVLIGPDAESKQWITAVADEVGAPFVVLNKERLGDFAVKVTVRDLETDQSYTPVLLDDIISTGHTMRETIGHLKARGLKSPVCIGVHALFVNEAHSLLLQSGAARVVTCNTIPHATNQIDISDLLIDVMAEKPKMA